MSGSAIIIGLAAVVVAGWLLVGPGGDGGVALGQTPSGGSGAQAAKRAEEWVKNNPPGRSTAQEHPIVKDNACPRISPAEREAIGLPPPTWVAAHGKVQPAVREALEKQKKLIESGDPMVGVQGDRPAGFQGTAYVDVYLRHDVSGSSPSSENRAMIKEVQTRLLSELAAAEFRLVFALKSTAGLIGYIDEAALGKLVSDPAVVAVGLDDQARPEDLPIAVRKERPRNKHGERPLPTEKIGKVEAEVYAALKESANGYVFVLWIVTQVPLGSEPSREAFEAQRAGERALQVGVLSAITADELWLRGGIGLCAGYVNAAGLAKLENHPDVVMIGLDEIIKFPVEVKRGKRQP